MACKESEIVSLMRRIKSLENENLCKENDVDSLMRRIKSLESENLRKENDIDNLMRRIKSLENEKLCKENEVDSLMRKIKLLEIENKNVCKENDVDNLMRRIKYLEIENKNLYKENDVDNLMKRIKLLETENKNLCEEIEIMKKKLRSSNSMEKKTLNTFNKIIPIFNSKIKGCTCKGNCANRVCGCMKKNLRCNESCKCVASTCKNKEDKENRGVNSSLITKDRKKTNQTEQLKENPKNSTITELMENNRLQEPVNLVDDVFYDAEEQELHTENPNIDAAKKLTFHSDEDTLDKHGIALSSIEETEETDSTLNELRTKNESDNKNATKTRKKSLNKEEKHSKLKTKKDLKDLDSKKQRKGVKLKRTSSVESEKEEEPNLEKINLRSRGARNFKFEKEISQEKEIRKSNDLEGVKSTSVTSCIKKISNIKHSKTLNLSKSSPSLNINDNDKMRITRSRMIGENSLRNVTKGTEKSKERNSQGLRRSLSSGAIILKRDKIQEKQIRDKKYSSRESLAKNEERSRTLNRSVSSDNVSKQSTSLISKLSHRRRSKSLDVSNDLAEDNPVDFSTSISFDPMQPTRQLQRSPIPPISFSEEPGTSISNSPPLFCRFLRSQDIKVPKLSSDILQDLNAEEVDHDEFKSKLIDCRKCGRSFFPHRINLHEAVCSKN